MSFTTISSDLERLVLDRMGDAVRVPAGLCRRLSNHSRLLVAAPMEWAFGSMSQVVNSRRSAAAASVLHKAPC